jgi:hypothetical protein
MPFVTDFESSSVQKKDASKIEQMFDYSQVEAALKLPDRGSVETAFARCAKHHFKARVGDNIKTKMLMPEEAKYPVWHSQVAVTVDLAEAHAGYVNQFPLWLGSLTEALISSVLSSGYGNALCLVGALTTYVTEVGPGLFSFGLKQKWTIAHE